jgi:hypothetical protein
MGEKQNQPFQLSFNPCLKVDFKAPALLAMVVCCWSVSWMNVWD